MHVPCVRTAGERTWYQNVLCETLITSRRFRRTSQTLGACTSVLRPATVFSDLHSKARLHLSVAGPQRTTYTPPACLVSCWAVPQQYGRCRPGGARPKYAPQCSQRISFLNHCITLQVRQISSMTSMICLLGCSPFSSHPVGRHICSELSTPGLGPRPHVLRSFQSLGYSISKTFRILD